MYGKKSFLINFLEIVREINSYFVFFIKKRPMSFPMSGFFAGLTVFKDQTSAYHSVWACLYILRTHVRPEVPLWQEEAHRTVQSAGRGALLSVRCDPPTRCCFPG